MLSFSLRSFAQPRVEFRGQRPQQPFIRVGMQPADAGQLGLLFDHPEGPPRVPPRPLRRFFEQHADIHPFVADQVRRVAQQCDSDIRLRGSSGMCHFQLGNGCADDFQAETIRSRTIVRRAQKLLQQSFRVRPDRPCTNREESRWPRLRSTARPASRSARSTARTIPCRARASYTRAACRSPQRRIRKIPFAGVEAES